MARSALQYFFHSYFYFPCPAVFLSFLRGCFMQFSYSAFFDDYYNKIYIILYFDYYIYYKNI